jgi:endogenous inhibitor of DNA gyrase (YacG/DUF329 family)
LTDDAASPGRASRAAPPCPICGKAASGEQLPFCGPRCADVDLGRWLTGQYRVPGPTLEEVEDEQDAVRARDGGD